MIKVLYLSLGAVLGANARYWLGLWAGKHWNRLVPHSTLLINLLGSLLLGLLLTTLTGSEGTNPRWHPLLAVGFMGAFTTFSSYAFESVDLMLNGRWLPGAVYLLGSAILGAGAVSIGIWLGAMLRPAI